MTRRCIILLFVLAGSNGVDSFVSRLDRFANASVQDRLLNLSNSGSSHCFLHEDIVYGGGILLKLVRKTKCSFFPKIELSGRVPKFQGPSEVHYGNVSQVNILETLIKKTCRFTTGIVGSNETIKSQVGRILSRVKRHHIVAFGSEEPSLPHNFPNNRVVVWAKQEKVRWYYVCKKTMIFTFISGHSQDPQMVPHRGPSQTSSRSRPGLNMAPKCRVWKEEPLCLP